MWHERTFDYFADCDITVARKIGKNT